MSGATAGPGLRAVPWSTPARLALLALVFFAGLASAAEVIPPAPRDHFNDYAGIVSPGTAQQLNRELVQFERDTSNQLVVAIFPRLPSASSIEDYTVRVAQAWGVGQKGGKNGAVLFIFSQDRKLYIQVGYGLEGALPDALCKRIIENEITPRFRGGDFNGGVAAGVHALMAAARGEYRGTGRLFAEGQLAGFIQHWGGVLFMLFFLLLVSASRRRHTVYSRRGRISPWINTGSWGGGGSWSGGGGGGSSGSFSGGGGSFGGGGAGGSW